MLLQQASSGTLEPAQVDRYLAKTALAQVDVSTSRSDGDDSRCEEWVQDKQTELAVSCKALCLTTEIKGVQTSSCDVNGMCSGFLNFVGDQRKGYRQMNNPRTTSYYQEPLEDGDCGIFPITGQRMYCSTRTPKQGRIPSGKSCPEIRLAASSRMASLGWTTIVAMLAMVGYMA